MVKAKQLAEDINKRKWIKIGRWIESVLFAYASIAGRKREFNKKTLDWDFEFENFLFLDYEYMFQKEDFEQMKAFFLSKIKKDKFWFKEYEKIVWKVSKDMIAFSEPFKNINFRDRSNEEIKKVFLGFCNKMNLAQPVLEGYQLVGELLEQKIRSLLENYLKRNNKNLSLMDEYLKDLNIPKKKIATVEEADALLKIAFFIQKNKLDLDSSQVKVKIGKHKSKYGWINTHHFIGDPNNTSPFFERLKFLLDKDCERELKKNEQMRIKEQKRLRELKQQLSSEKDLLTYIDITQDMSHLKPFRVDAYYIAWINLRHLFEEIGNRCNATVDDLMWLTYEEIEEVIDTNKIDKGLISERRKEYLIVKIQGDLNVISGKILKGVKSNLKKEDYSNILKVKGSMACEGHIKGIVKVLHSEKDIKNVEKGDIIVISMTDPTYIPTMEKAAAFITDYGGILCHAAIISREMGKPCVIGTKIATKVFKDRDLVEVNANKGIVKIIKRN